MFGDKLMVFRYPPAVPSGGRCSCIIVDDHCFIRIVAQHGGLLYYGYTTFIAAIMLSISFHFMNLY